MRASCCQSVSRRSFVGARQSKQQTGALIRNIRQHAPVVLAIADLERAYLHAASRQRPLQGIAAADDDQGKQAAVVLRLDQSSVLAWDSARLG